MTDLATLQQIRTDRREEARKVRRLAERIARLALKFETEQASNYAEAAHLSEMLGNARVIVNRLESLQSRTEAARAQPTLI